MTEDANAARKWYEASVDTKFRLIGSEHGMQSLGKFAETGRGGMRRDLNIAFDWYQKSVAAGLKSANADVERIKASMTMSPTTPPNVGERMDAPAKDGANRAVEAAKSAASSIAVESAAAKDAAGAAVEAAKGTARVAAKDAAAKAVEAAKDAAKDAVKKP